MITMELSEHYHLVIAGLCLLLGFLYFNFNWITGKPKNLPPGPPSLPIIGHLHLIKSPAHRSLHEMSQKYGQVMYIQLGTLKSVVVSSPAAVEECFTKNDIILADRPQTLSGKHLNYNYQTMGFTNYGDHWRALRRLASQELFSTTRLNMLASVREDEVRSLLRKVFDKSKGTWVQVKLRQSLIELIFDIMLRMISGKQYDGSDEVSQGGREFKRVMDEVFELFNVSLNDLFPILQTFDFGGLEKRMNKVMKKMDSFLQNLLDDNRREWNAREDKDESKMSTMIDVILSLQQSNPQFYNDVTIKGLISAVVGAGTETTSLTMEWALSNLLNHPEAMEKVKAELNAHVGQDRLVEESDIPKLTYFQNVILETLRLYPAGALGIPHMASQDCTICGYHIPKGTMVMVNAWTLGRDPNNWVEPTRFIPERFEKRVVEGYSGIPFGAGRRICPGANVAKRIMVLTLGSLLQCFEFKRIGEKEIDMEEAPGITLPKAEPLVALMRPRPDMENLLVNL